MGRVKNFNSFHYKDSKTLFKIALINSVSECKCQKHDKNIEHFLTTHIKYEPIL